MELENLLAGQPRKGIGRINIDSFDLNFLGYHQTGNPKVLPFGEIGRLMDVAVDADTDKGLWSLERMGRSVPYCR